MAYSLSRLLDHTRWTHHTRSDSSVHAISPTYRTLPDNTQHSQQTDIHAPGEIRTRNPSQPAATTWRPTVQNITFLEVSPCSRPHGQRDSTGGGIYNLSTRCGWCSVSRPGRLYPRKTWYSVQEAGWASGPGWTGAENLAPPWFDPRTVQPFASRYTDCAIPTPSKI